VKARKGAQGQSGSRPPVVGIGTDLVEVARLEKSLKRTASFAEKVFTAGERATCEGRAHPGEAYAARFAAKEAFLKAVGRGIFEGIALTDIEVVREGDGEPLLKLGRSAARALSKRGASKALVTLSHAGNCAIAFVLVQR